MKKEFKKSKEDCINNSNIESGEPFLKEYPKGTNESSEGLGGTYEEVSLDQINIRRLKMALDTNIVSLDNVQ